jgi:hypothetical protein
MEEKMGIAMEKEEEEEEKVAGCGLNQQQLVSSLGGVAEIRNTEQLHRPVEDVMDVLRTDSRSVTPEILDVPSECSTKLEELPSSIDGENGGDDIHVRVVKIKMTNPSVHVDGYNGPIHVLKSLWKKGNGFSLNLRFDFDSFSDLQNFIDYSTDISEKVHTLNKPFVKDKYIANLDVTFTNAVIVEKE